MKRISRHLVAAFKLLFILRKCEAHVHISTKPSDPENSMPFSFSYYFEELIFMQEVALNLLEIFLKKNKEKLPENRNIINIHNFS